MPQVIPSTVASCDCCALAQTTSQVSWQATGEFFTMLLNTDGFPPRWKCGTGWTPGHGWLHIVSDFGIFGAYFAIPIVLAYFIVRRKDIPFPPVLWLFVAFIALCGMGHLVEGTIFWNPWYRLSGVIKAATALVSWVTVVALIRVLPAALDYPGLAIVNSQLEIEVRERKAAEAKLKQSYDELHEFAQNVMGREGRVIELKQEVNDLLLELGRPTRYLSDSADG